MTTPDTAPSQGSGKAADPRERIVDALMALAARRDWPEIELGDIAAEAGVTLGELRSAFPSKGAILGAFSRRVDLQVLAEAGDEMVGEPARDRLFDVLMRRIDMLAPHKIALKRMASALRSDITSLAALNSVALNSQRYMLAAAGISTESGLATLRLQGAVIAFGRTLDVWFEDEDPGLARTMSHLDKELRRGETLLKRADDVRRLASPLFALAGAVVHRRPFRERRSSRDDPAEPPAPMGAAPVDDILDEIDPAATDAVPPKPMGRAGDRPSAI